MTTTTALLLAAGQSRRFGPDCKLQAIHRGKPLVRHAADAIIATGLPRIAVVSDPAVAALLPEFQIVCSSGEQSQSLRHGVAAVTTGRVLIVLGDMPNIDAALLRDVAASAPAAASDGGPPGPPASFDRSIFNDLRNLSGDKGARAVLRSMVGLRVITVPPAVLIDIDQPDQIQPHA